MKHRSIAKLIEDHPFLHPHLEDVMELTKVIDDFWNESPATKNYDYHLKTKWRMRSVYDERKILHTGEDIPTRINIELPTDYHGDKVYVIISAMEDAIINHLYNKSKN